MDSSSRVPHPARLPGADEEQPQSVDHLARQVARLRTLQQISHKLNSKLDLEGVITSILEEAIGTVGAERGCLFLVDAATGSLEMRLSRHFPTGRLDDGSFRLSRTVVERVWRTGQAVLTANALEDTEFTKADSVVKYALRSILCVPLHLQEQRIGVLYLDNRLKAGQFQEDDLALALAIADQAAVALRNVQLHQEVVERAAELSRLHGELQQRLAEMQSTLAVTRALVSEISLDNLLEFIMAQAEYLTDAEGAAVLLLSDDDQSLEVARPGEAWLGVKTGSKVPVQGSLVGLAFIGQQVQVSNSAQEDKGTLSVRALLGPTVLRSLLCAPLVAHGKSLGVLLVWNKRAQGFAAHDIRLMGLFADQAALAWHNAQLHARNRQMAVEQERHRLARDLHDSVTQSLYSIALAAQTALRLLGQANADSPIRDAIEHIQATSRIALAEMREQLYDLYPASLAEAGLVESLAQHCEFLRRCHSLQVELKAGPEPALSLRRREALYHIAREALWNAVKHAHATRVEISLATGADELVLSIADDGVGFEPSNLPLDKTMGLRNMEERTRHLGGSFELVSSLGQGTRVTVRISRGLADDSQSS